MFCMRLLRILLYRCWWRLRLFFLNLVFLLINLDYYRIFFNLLVRGLYLRYKINISMLFIYVCLDICNIFILNLYVIGYIDDDFFFFG